MPIYFGEIVRQCIRIGYFSLPVVGLTAIFTGAALALNIYVGGSRFNAEQFVPNIVVLGIGAAQTYFGQKDRYDRIEVALEEATQDIAIGKAPVAVLGKGRTVRHAAFQPKPAYFALQKLLSGK